MQPYNSTDTAATWKNSRFKRINKIIFISISVETHPIYRSSPAKIDSKFHAEEITYDSAVLKWRPLNQLKGQYSGNISIAFKQSENSGKWIWSKSLNASTVSYVLSNLLPGRKYNVKMVWQAKMFGVNDFPLTTTSISTKKIPGKIQQAILDLAANIYCKIKLFDLTKNSQHSFFYFIYFFFFFISDSCRWSLS